MSIKIRQINREIVRPVQIQIEDEDLKTVLGEALFSEIYANIFIESKKKSGKTTVLNTIVRRCANKDTTVIVFCSTLNKDKNHLALKKYCRLVGIPYVGYTSIKEDDVDILEVLLEKLQNEARDLQEKEDDDESQDEQNHILMFNESDDEENEKPKKRKSKYRAPQYLIILDDISNELKSVTLTKLLKSNRHYKMKIVVSTQYVHDLAPQSIKQIDYCLVFKGEREDKLLKLHKDLDLALDFEIFLKIYQNATAAKFSFLYIDVRGECYRKCFTHLYDLKNIQ